MKDMAMEGVPQGDEDDEDWAGGKGDRGAQLASTPPMRTHVVTSSKNLSPVHSDEALGELDKEPSSRPATGQTEGGHGSSFGISSRPSTADDSGGGLSQPGTRPSTGSRPHTGLTSFSGHTTARAAQGHHNRLDLRLPSPEEVGGHVREERPAQGETEQGEAVDEKRFEVQELRGSPRRDASNNPQAAREAMLGGKPDRRPPGLRVALPGNNVGSGLVSPSRSQYGSPAPTSPSDSSPTGRDMGSFKSRQFHRSPYAR